METLTVTEFLARIQGGKIFTVCFIKKGDGSYRVMNCRRGVTKGVKGVLPPGHRAAEDARNQVLTVYDMQKYVEGQDNKGAFRRINLADMLALKMDGKSYVFDFDAQVFTQVVQYEHFSDEE